MKILVTGGTGLIGSDLVQKLLNNNHEVVLLLRNLKKGKEIFSENPKLSMFHFDALKEDKIPREIIQNLDGIYNLMGDNIGVGHWSEKKKKSIFSSRVDLTIELNKALEENLTKPLEFYFQTSAVGIYKDSDGDELLNENSNYGEDFLAGVCVEWEKTLSHFNLTKRKIIGRFGVVVTPKGGLLKELRTPFKLGFGATIGSGKQWLSWIHLDDLVSILIEIGEEESFHGVYNLVAPNPITNAEFSEIYASSLGAKLLPFKVPDFLMEMILGEKSRLVLASQRAIPRNYLERGGKFKFENFLDVFKEV